MKYFNLYAEFWLLYFISTPSNHSLLRFWFYLRYKNKYVLFDFYFAKFNFLRFISTPSNHSPICVWFYLRYKNKKNYTKLSVVLFRCLKVANFLFPSLSQFFFYCWIETCCLDDSPPIMQGSFVYFSGCAYCIAQCWGKL